ncbi:hypothetical protein E2C01_025620 [Portunus trituberculatus]|uniref:Secreted protein n=1 Tax=Portunus trituberculatus TaxID=210409 RepID=A0A5B7EDE2_PORTR|nr:hypothetical protein [Portunus trituberculatus]
MGLATLRLLSSSWILGWVVGGEALEVRTTKSSDTCNGTSSLHALGVTATGPTLWPPANAFMEVKP